MKKVRVLQKRKPVLVGRKLQRIGDIYFEVNWWDGFYWQYKECNTREEVNQFIKLHKIEV